MQSFRLIFKAAVVILAVITLLSLVWFGLAALLPTMKVVVLLFLIWVVVRHFCHVDLLGINPVQSTQQTQQQTP